MELDEPLPELVELALDLERGLLVALAPAREPSKVIGSPQATETGAKFPIRQVWLPWIAAGISGTDSLIATIAAPG